MDERDLKEDCMKGICFYCKTVQTFELKKLSDQREHYVCKNCNACNSELRLLKERSSHDASNCTKSIPN